MADITLAEKTKGINYIIHVYDYETLDAYGNPSLISFSALGITKAYLTIKTTDFVTILLDRRVLVLSANHDCTWEIEAGNVPSVGDYYGQIDFEDNVGNIVIPNYPYLTVSVVRKLKP